MAELFCVLIFVFSTDLLFLTFLGFKPLPVHPSDPLPLVGGY